MLSQLIKITKIDISNVAALWERASKAVKESNERDIDIDSKIRIDLQRKGGRLLAEAVSPVNS